MTKAELKEGLERARAEFESDRILANEYALLLDELLSKYLGVRKVSVDDGTVQGGGVFIELAALAAAVDEPAPCCYCGVLVAHDVQGQLFATDPAEQMPWRCLKSPGSRHGLPPEQRTWPYDGAEGRARLTGSLGTGGSAADDDYGSGDWITYRPLYPELPDFRAQVQRVDARNRGLVVVDEQPGMPLEHLVAWDRVVGKAAR